MIEVLESFKQLGMYAVMLVYGEDIGCDDSDVKPQERSVHLYGYPVGCLGEVRVAWVGKVKDLPTANFKKKPTKLSNPPEHGAMDGGGYFIWGVDESVDHILEKPFFGSWED